MKYFPIVFQHNYNCNTSLSVLTACNGSMIVRENTFS